MQAHILQRILIEKSILFNPFVQAYCIAYINYTFSTHWLV